MSYILDALRKSQQARRPAAAPRRGAVHNLSLTIPVSGWWLALGFLLLSGIAVAGVMLWRGMIVKLPDPPPAPVAEPAAATAAPEPVPVPAVAEKSSAGPLPQAAVGKTRPAADLAEQAKLPAPALPKKPVVIRSVQKPAVDPRPEPTRTAGAAAAMPLPVDDTPLLQQMPRDFQGALPPLAVTIHVYSHDESQRILFINNREYRKGNQMEGGIRVEEIVPDGAVLSYRGERFKLSRPR